MSLFKERCAEMYEDAILGNTGQQQKFKSRGIEVGCCQ
jgi:hypothetical protein